MGKTISEEFQCLKEKFPKISATKLKEGLFIWPKIRKLIKYNDFMRRLNTAEQVIWQTFIWTFENFLGNYKALTHKDEIPNLLNAYNKLRFWMSLKIHFLHSHLLLYRTTAECFIVTYLIKSTIENHFHNIFKYLNK
jgi:hypothetical protein